MILLTFMIELSRYLLLLLLLGKTYQKPDKGYMEEGLAQENPSEQREKDKQEDEKKLVNEETTPSVNTPVPPMGNVLASASGSSVASIMDHYELIADEIVGVVQRNNPQSSTEIIGDIRSRPNLHEDTRHSNIVALCTLDGESMLCDINHCLLMCNPGIIIFENQFCTIGFNMINN